MTFENPKARPGGRGVDVSHGELPSGAALDAIRLKEAEVEVDSLAAGGLGFDDLEPDPKQLDEMDRLAFDTGREPYSGNVRDVRDPSQQMRRQSDPVGALVKDTVTPDIQQNADYPPPKDMAPWVERPYPWGTYPGEIGPAPDWFKRVNPKHNW